MTSLSTSRPPEGMKAVILSDYYDMSFAIPVYGFAMPIFAFIVTICNSIVVCIFSRHNMRSATNGVLSAIAVVVLAALLAPMPAYIYMFTMGNYREFVRYDWCIVYAVTVAIMPQMVHTIWIWLTLLLAIQRFMCVTRPLLVRSIFTLKRTYITIFVIIVASTVLHLVRFWEVDFSPMETPSNIIPNTTIVGCIFNNSMSLDGDKYLYLNLYGWTTITLDGFVPCIALIIFDSLMLHRLRRSEDLRLELQCDKDKNKHGTHHHKESRKVTWMVFSIVAVIVTLEIPWACVMGYFLVRRSEVSAIYKTQPIMVVSEFIMCASYTSIFVIYCLMSSTFRRALWKLLKCDWHSRDDTSQLSRTTFL